MWKRAPDMDALTYVRFAASLALVLGLILAGLWLVRRLGLVQAVPRTGGKKRLGLVESMVIDSRRRLILVRKDDNEHLILLGSGTDLLIESRPITESKSWAETMAMTEAEKP